MTNSSHPETSHELSALFHADALPVGTMLGEFEVTGLLGVGGFGMVYDAFDHSLQRMVAIKEYMPSALAGRAEGSMVTCRSSSDRDALSAGLVSFIAEARLLAQFDHPSLVKVYRFWKANNTAYMVMPLYKGMTLKYARTQAQSPPPEAWLRPMLWSVLGALKYLHAHNVVHRDISPDNIFLQEAGPPVLLDLGAARRAIGESSQKHTAILKVNYAPIEQYADASDIPQGPWTDLYSLAAVVHGSLCNAQPLPATFRVVRDRLPPFATVAKTVESIFGQQYSAQFIQAFGHALEIQPHDRPQTVQAFVQELGLSAPVGPQTMTWRSHPALGNATPVVDSEAKTVYQVTRPPVTTVDAPVTDNSALELVSAYGVLDQESPLLAPHLEAVPAPAGALGPVDGASAVGVASAAGLGKDAGPIDTVHRPSKVRPTRRRSASATVAPKATAAESFAKVKIAVVVAVCVSFLIAGAVLWNAKRPRSEPQIVQPPVAAKPDTSTPPQSAVEPAPALAAPAQKPNAAAVTPAKAAGAGAPAAVGAASAANTANTAVGAKAKPTGRLPTGTDTSGTSAKPDADAPSGTNTSPKAVAPTVAATATNASAPPRANVARGLPTPTETCADRNFLVRPMCIHLECEKPEFTQTAFCIDNARRLKESGKPADR